MSSNDRLKCSFCGKTQDQVKKLIAGPEVYICDECGISIDRDYNAAQNILDEGLKYIN